MINAVLLIISYLLGSVPMGLLLTKFAGKGDLRKVGSGNIGATNVMRVGGLRMAALTWLLDMAKVVAAVLLGRAFVDVGFGAWCGFIAIVGHCFPIWLRFHGGKGVSGLFGLLLAISPLTFLFIGIEWLLVALTSGYSSLGALVVFFLVPVFGFIIDINVGFAFLAVALLCLIRHRENIIRLVHGKESKVEWKWKK
ncbi:MAG: glycerol-3-phosphate 1-O-acyltransferase PlsY [Alphaproteobacteria bacterium]|nr:glycerol-3-phosphate 1-O-acyltransferase PlsY [Alphaproteobacteria bacterium]MBP5363784.1 glycerol-3-phosphate 1-O-acyltransferase PlsY [Alphaproteobacteria bacterium]